VQSRVLRTPLIPKTKGEIVIANRDHFVKRFSRSYSVDETKKKKNEDDDHFDPEENLPPELKNLKTVPIWVSAAILFVTVALFALYGRTWAEHIFVDDDDDDD
jgi:hypothetical protein